MKIKYLTPVVDKKILVLLAGIMWCGVGVMLIRYAVVWLWTSNWKEQELFYAVGFLTAIPIHQFGFQKIADKNLNRLLPITKRMSIFSFITVRSYFIILIMVAMGIALRHSSIPKRYLSVVYNGIGLALILSGIKYLRSFIKLLSKKEINK